MPVYNGEKYLKSTLNSIVNQSFGIENIQVIIVNDCSTDKTKDILDDYSLKYPSFHIIHLDKNTGAPFTPRNIALKYVKAKYIMFLDSDDEFLENSCEILYNKINEYECDIAFGRYLRNYPEQNITRKSYSPYAESLSQPYNNYLDDLINGTDLKGIMRFAWKNIISRFIYGKPLTKENNEEIFIKNIKEENKDEIAILKILPSFWTKIYRTDLILDNEITFPNVIAGEDLNFLLESYFKSKRGILFLNNQIVYNYNMRLETEEKSVTKNINFRLIYESLKSYRLASELSDKHEIKNKDIILNPFLLNWINLWLSRKNSKEENNLFKEEINLIKKGKKHGLIYRLLLNSINLFLKIKS